MYHLFPSNQTNIVNALVSANDEEIRQSSIPVVFGRGLEYFKSGDVCDIHAVDSRKVTAKVHGTQTYKVTLKLENAAVIGSCTCPYDEVCKHMVAVLLKAKQQFIDTVDMPPSVSHHALFADYLNTLPHESLVELMQMYAPESFRNTVINTMASFSDAEQILGQVERSVNFLLDDEDLYYNPEEFQINLDEELQRLSGLESKLHPRLGEFILKLIKDVGAMMDEGYYFGHYDEESFAFSSTFDNLVTSYVRSLPFADKIVFAGRFIESESASSYDMITLRIAGFINDDELPLLQSYILEKLADISPDIVSNFYSLIKKTLSNQDREKILLHMLSRDVNYATEYTNILVEQQKDRQAIHFLDEWLGQDKTLFGQDNLYRLRLTLKHKNGMTISQESTDCLKRFHTAETLRFIATINPQEARRLEPVLRQLSEVEFLKYLDKDNRIEEANDFIKKSKKITDFEIERFYKKYKTSFVSEARVCFLSKLSRALEKTDEGAYSDVADMLSHLKVIDPELAIEKTDEIRVTFKRRKNLMEKISSI